MWSGSKAATAQQGSPPSGCWRSGAARVPRRWRSAGGRVGALGGGELVGRGLNRSPQGGLTGRQHPVAAVAAAEGTLYRLPQLRPQFLVDVAIPSFIEGRGFVARVE